jgi:hypothetical protein
MERGIDDRAMPPGSEVSGTDRAVSPVADAAMTESAPDVEELLPHSPAELRQALADVRASLATLMGAGAVWEPFVTALGQVVPPADDVSDSTLDAVRAEFRNLLRALELAWADENPSLPSAAELVGGGGRALGVDPAIRAAGLAGRRGSSPPLRPPLTAWRVDDEPWTTEWSADQSESIVDSPTLPTGTEPARAAGAEDKSAEAEAEAGGDKAAEAGAATSVPLTRSGAPGSEAPPPPWHA